MFHEFISQLCTIKNGEIPFYYRNQFKIKENFINPNSKYFEAIAQKLIQEEKHGIKRKWDKQCKMMFIWVLSKFFQLKNKKNINPNKAEWLELSSILQTDEAILKQRWITLINPQNKSINWDSEEDTIIRSLMNEQEHKHIWTSIALELYNHNDGQFVRTPKQVRERWMNYLNPKLNKTNWTQDEDNLLLTMVIKNGKRWSFISCNLEGRTENQVKNRFKSLIQRIQKDEEDDEFDEIQAIKDYLRKNGISADENSNLEEIQKKQSFKLQICSKNNQQNYQQSKKIKKKRNNPNFQNKKLQIKETNNIQVSCSQSINQDEVQEIDNNENNLQIKSELIQQNQQYEFQQLQQQYDNGLIQQSQIINPYFANQYPSQFDLQQYQQQNQLVYQAFRTYIEGVNYKQQQQFYLEQMQQYQQSPFPNFNQTPMTYTPTQQYQFYYNQHTSPQWNPSPFQDTNFQQQQPQPEEIYNEKMRQQQFNHKLEFLNSSSLVSDWKEKRENKKTQLFQYMSLFDR